MNIAAPPPQTPSMTSGLSGMPPGMAPTLPPQPMPNMPQMPPPMGMPQMPPARRTAAGAMGAPTPGMPAASMPLMGGVPPQQPAMGMPRARLLRWAHYSATVDADAAEPIDTARAATGTNVATAVANANLQNINQVTPAAR